MQPSSPRQTRTKGGRGWLYFWILSALVEAGGQDSKQGVIHRLLPRLASELADDDRGHVKTGETRIENSIAWACDELVKETLIGRTSIDI